MKTENQSLQGALATSDLTAGVFIFMGRCGGQEGRGPGIDAYVFTEKMFHVHKSREPEHPHDLNWTLIRILHICSVLGRAAVGEG